MNKDQVFNNFLEKLKKEKNEKEVGEFLAALLKFSAAELYVTITAMLTEEDMTAVEAIPDDIQAEEELINRFKLRTGMTPQEFVIQLRDKIAANYI